MAQEIILVLLAGLIGVLFAGLVGFVWMMVRAGLDDAPHTHDNRQGSASPEPRDGEEAHEGSPRQSKITAGQPDLTQNPELLKRSAFSNQPSAPDLTQNSALITQNFPVTQHSACSRSH
jgi:hypothetical protein